MTFPFHCSCGIYIKNPTKFQTKCERCKMIIGLRQSMFAAEERIKKDIQIIEAGKALVARFSQKPQKGAKTG